MSEDPIKTLYVEKTHRGTAEQIIDLPDPDRPDPVAIYFTREIDLWFLSNIVRNMIIVTVFLLIMNQTDFHSVHDPKENCFPEDSIFGS